MQRNARSPAYEVGLVCYPFYPTKDSGRGVDRYCIELIDNLREQGQGVRLDVIEQGSSTGAWAAGKKLCGLVADLVLSRVRVYHAVSPPAGAVMLLLGKRLGVVTVHDLLPFQVGGYNPGPKLAYARWCITLSAKLADALIVPFTVTKDELVRAHGVPASKIHVVNYGLDHATYHPRPETPRNARRILYVGELSRAKGVDVLIEAFAALKRRVPDAELWIGGKGKHRKDLEELARALGADGVKFLGFVPEEDLPALYASSAMMVFPSRYGFGLSTLEAMACGTPVIVTATLDAPEFIGDAGLMIEAGDAAGLAEHMASILLSPAVSDRLSRKGIDRARQFSWARMAEDTRRVYEQVLTTKERG